MKLWAEGGKLDAARQIRLQLVLVSIVICLSVPYPLIRSLSSGLVIAYLQVDVEIPVEPELYVMAKDRHDST